MMAIFKREFRSYFLSPIGYIFMGVFLLLSGGAFTMINLFAGSAEFVAVLANVIFVFIMTVPVLTMRLMTDEAKQKTDQLLLTSPLNVSGIVLGKYFAAVAVFLITLVVTWIYPVIISFFGSVALWEVVGGYIGFFLLGCAYIAIGLFISSLTDSQAVAAISTFGAILILQILGGNLIYLPSNVQASMIFAGILVLLAAILVRSTTKNIYAGIITMLLGAAIMAAVYFINPNLYSGFVIRFFRWFLLTGRYVEFTRGVVSFSSVVYYISFTAFFLFLTVRIIDKKRWS